MRRIAAFLVAAALAFPTLAAEIDFPALSGRVVDEANILTPAAERQIDSKLAGLEAKTGDQLVVVTLRDLRGRTIEEYGYRLGRHWGLGEKNKDNGALLIVAPTERTMRIEVGYGLEGRLTDAVSSVIIHQGMLPAFRANQPEEGILNGVDTLITILQKGYDEAVNTEGDASSTSKKMLGGVFGALLTALWPMIFLFVLMQAFKKNRSALGDILLLAMAAKGGRSGGMHIGRSGGGFRGGGGSFGGGGASGRW